MNIKVIFEKFGKQSFSFSTLRLIIFISIIFLIMAYFITQLAGEPIFNSEGFIERSKSSLLSLSFYTSIRPFTTDLFYKIWGSQPSRVVIGQQFFSVFCWAFLGFAISYTIGNRKLSILSIIIFSTVSLWWNIAGWTYVMRSESVCFSFFAMWYALIILLAKKENTQWILLGILCVITLLFSFTRDNLPYFLLSFVAITLIIVFIINRYRIRNCVRYWIVYFIFVLVIFGLQTASTQIGARHQFSLINVIFQRILTNQENINYFQSKGMPVDSDMIKNWKGKWASSHNWALYTDPKYENFMAFTLHEGKYVYGQFLLTHPLYTIKSAWNSKSQIRSRNLYGYTNPPPSQFIVQAVSTLWNCFSSRGLLIFFIIFSFIASVFVIRTHVYPFVIITCIMLNGIFIYHADAMEVMRHSLIVVIVLSTVFMHLCFLIADIIARDNLIHKLWVGLLRSSGKD